MANNSRENSKIRTRSDLSSTSSNENNSPLSKKTKSGPEEDEFPNMADEWVKDKLEVILEKVNKIDLVNETVSRIETSISSLEGRMTAVEETQKVAQKDIEDLKESKNFMDEVVSKQVGKMVEELEFLKTRGNLQRVALETLSRRYDDLETKDLYLEAYSRRENIKFLNIEEERGENTEEIMRAFLRDELKLTDSQSIEIQRVHRNGRSFGDKPRPILARFVRYKDVEKILQRGRNLKGTNYRMFTDLPRELVERRKQLLPILKKAKEKSIPASFSKSQPDRLFVKGKEWRSGDDLDEL